MFLADVMLIKLSRWLRIMGLECISPTENETDDDILIYRALKEGLTLLTMDREMSQLAKSSCTKVILIPSRITNVEDQLVYVLSEARINPLCLNKRLLCT